MKYKRTVAIVLALTLTTQSTFCSEQPSLGRIILDQTFLWTFSAICFSFPFLLLDQHRHSKLRCEYINRASQVQPSTAQHKAHENERFSMVKTIHALRNRIISVDLPECAICTLCLAMGIFCTWEAGCCLQRIK